MATRKSGTQTRGAARPKDKGTRGGRPEPVPADTGQRQRNGRSRSSTPPGASGKASPAQAVGGGGLAAARPETGGEQRAPRWYQAVMFALTACALGVSVYLTIAHFTSPKLLICSDKGLVNCGEVTTSPQSYVFGIPVAVLGLAYYLVMFVINSPLGWRVRWQYMPLVRVASAAAGMLFVLYLIYAELILIKAICLWCTSVHIMTFLLFTLTMFGVSSGYLKLKLRAGA